MTKDSYDFNDIAPFDGERFHEKLEQLVNETGFETAVRSVMPDVNLDEYIPKLLAVSDNEELQQKIMYPILESVASKTTSGITVNGLDNVHDGISYTFITNHRDIVLDASFLNLCFLRNGKPTSEIAIGNNLLIYDWIADLVRLNKSFIVKRNLPMAKALEAAIELSAYIHYAITKKHSSVWIAQREGRTKDSNDLTQESLVKMLALAGEGDFIDHLLEINLEPVSISYEYDPNDYLKTREFLMKRLDASFKKTQHDDLFSMETGLLSYKGAVHFDIAPCINDKISAIDRSLPKASMAKEVCSIIDNAIHSRYRIFPINYIAYDMLYGQNRFADKYTHTEATEFKAYISCQLEKVNIPDLSELDRRFMWHMMLTMYSNPLRNKLIATGESVELN